MALGQTIGPSSRATKKGRIAEVLNVTVDITERHEMEDRLREAQTTSTVASATTDAELGRINTSLRREIEQRQLSELELRNNNRVLRAVFDAMSDGVQIVNSHGLVMTNRAAIGF